MVLAKEKKYFVAQQEMRFAIRQNSAADVAMIKKKASRLLTGTVAM